MHGSLKNKKIPVWMDVSGGMAADIYDSVRTPAKGDHSFCCSLYPMPSQMAQGVQNAAVLLCLMSKKVWASHPMYCRGLPLARADSLTLVNLAGVVDGGVWQYGDSKNCALELKVETLHRRVL